MTRGLTPRFSPSPPRPEPGRTVTQREGKTPAAPSRLSTVLPTRGQPGGTCCSIPQISPPIPGTANPGRSAAPPGALGTGAAALPGRARGRVWGRIGPRAHPGGGSDLSARPQPAARSGGPRAPGLPGTPLLPRSRPRARPRPLRTGAGGAGPGRLPPAAASPRGTEGQRGARAEPRQRPAPSRRASRRFP